MKRIYFSALPLYFTPESAVPQAVNFELAHAVPRRFPILHILAQTMQPGDEAVVVTVRQQKEGQTNPNVDAFQKELEQMNIPNVQVKHLCVEESQGRNVVLKMFCAMLDVLEPDACYYSCMTFGTKSWPMVLTSVLRYAEKVLDDTQIKGVYYQEALRENGQITQLKMYDMSVLFALDAVVDMVAESEGPGKEDAIRVLLEGC